MLKITEFDRLLGKSRMTIPKIILYGPVICVFIKKNYHPIHVQILKWFDWLRNIRLSDKRPGGTNLRDRCLIRDAFWNSQTVPYQALPLYFRFWFRSDVFPKKLVQTFSNYMQKTVCQYLSWFSRNVRSKKSNFCVRLKNRPNSNHSKL